MARTGPTVWLECPECGGERPFVQPPCADGHGAECPERSCTECGAAVFVGPLPSVKATVKAPAGVTGTRTRAQRRLRGVA